MSDAPAQKPPTFDQKLDQIQSKFAIADRDGLFAAIGHAMWAYAGRSDVVPDFRERDTLDDLEKPLDLIIQLLSDELNSNRLAQHIRSLSADEQSILPFYLPDFVKDLEFLKDTALRAHRERAQGSGQLPREDLLAAIKVLAEYWISIGRKYTKLHPWPIGESGHPEPTTSGEMFIWACINYFTPVDLSKPDPCHRSNFETACHSFSLPKD